MLNEASSFLEKNRIEHPRLNAERLLCKVLHLERIELYVQFERPVSPEERDSFKALLKERVRHVPLQYLEGNVDFYKVRLRVTPDVLIPRPETEILVESVLNQIDASQTSVLDIGTGSGAIAIALAMENRALRVTGLDLSEKALAVARENAQLNGVEDRICFVRDDILRLKSSLPEFDGIVSNPPYVALSEWETLAPEITEHEPRVALCDEADGYTFYRFLAEHGHQWLKSGGKIWVEVGDNQDEQVKSLFEENGFLEIRIIPDLNGTGRVVEAGRG